MVAGTLEITWLIPMLHQYSFPATVFFRKPEMPGLAAMEEEKIKKQRYTIEYYSVIKNEILPFAATQMDLREKDKCCMISFICRI